jgi:repressor LexA
MKDSFADRMKKAMEIRDIKQVDVVERTGIGKSAISQYISGKYEPKQKAIFKIAEALNVSESWLMGYDVPMDRINTNYPHNILKIEVKKFPMLGKIAAGQPIFAEEQFETYVEADSKINADFCLKVQGDSMVNARINNNDIVFIKQQSDINDGEIAVILIDNEATLKRVYKKENEIILVSENPAYKPMVFKNEELFNVRILGKAIAFQSKIV